MVDRVRPLKIEDAASGGTQEDLYPTTADPNEDFLDARGLTVQNATSDDEVARIERDYLDNMRFRDGIQTTSVTLTELLEPAPGGILCKLIIATTGGVVYDNAGELVLKEND